MVTAPNETEDGPGILSPRNQGEIVEAVEWLGREIANAAYKQFRYSTDYSARWTPEAILAVVAMRHRTASLSLRCLKGDIVVEFGYAHTAAHRVNRAAIEAQAHGCQVFQRSLRSLPVGDGGDLHQLSPRMKSR